MSDNKEERRVKARHDVTPFYQRRSVKRTTSCQNLPRGDMSVSSDPSPNNSNNSSDDDVEDNTYMPSPRTRPHGKGVASASGNGVAREEEIEEEEERADGEEEEEIFDIDEINPTSYIHMRTLIFRLPLNPDWREKISYKGKTDLVREKKKKNPRLVQKEPVIDYIFHIAFQHDFYESIIITKNKLVEISQWIDWSYMEGKGCIIFNEVVATCRAKHLREFMALQKNWNNEIIAQFFATLYVEERGDTKKLHWMIEGKRYKTSYG
jgi:hypothetical protein